MNCVSEITFISVDSKFDMNISVVKKKNNLSYQINYLVHLSTQQYHQVDYKLF